MPRDRVFRYPVRGKRASRDGLTAGEKPVTRRGCASSKAATPSPSAASTWPFFALGALAVLLLALALRPPASRSPAPACPSRVRAFFLTITDIGARRLDPDPVARACSSSRALLALAMRKQAQALPRARPDDAALRLHLPRRRPPGARRQPHQAHRRARPPRVLRQRRRLQLPALHQRLDVPELLSGHATTTFAVAFVIGFLAPRWFCGWRSSWRCWSPCRASSSACTIPTDVIGGAIVGTLGAYAVRNLFASRRMLFEFRPDGTVGLRSFAAVSRLVRKRGRTTR